MGGSVQTRPDFIDGDYQTFITRRQFTEKNEDRLQPRSRTTSPSPSAGRVYPIPIERTYETREPRPLRHTVSHSDVFDDYSKRSRRRQSPEYPVYLKSRGQSSEYPGYYSRSRGQSPDAGYRLRRAQSRTDNYYPESRPLSRAESWENSVNNIFKLYQTRDCLGNIIQEL